MTADFCRLVKQYDSGFDPAGIRRPDLGALPPGSYSFAVLDVTPRVVKGDKPLVALVLKVLDGKFAGQEYEHAWFLTSQVAINVFGANLARLGLDVHRTVDGRGFSEKVPEYLGRLPGVRFLAVVSKQKESGYSAREFTNLHVQRRIYGDPAPAEQATNLPS